MLWEPSSLNKTSPQEAIAALLIERGISINTARKYLDNVYLGLYFCFPESKILIYLLFIYLTELPENPNRVTDPRDDSYVPTVKCIPMLHTALHIAVSKK